VVSPNLEKLDGCGNVFSLVADGRIERESNGPGKFSRRPANHRPVGRFIVCGGEFPQRGGPQDIVHTGTSYKITPNQQLDFHVGFGLSSAAVSHFIGFGYSFQVQALHRQ
jgi:hypothetical protein